MRYCWWMTVQIAVRIPDELAARVDELVSEGVYATRTEAIRAGLAAVVERAARREIDRAIVEGYGRCPPTAAEERWAAASGRDLIADEPW